MLDQKSEEFYSLDEYLCQIGNSMQLESEKNTLENGKKILVIGIYFLVIQQLILDTKKSSDMFTIGLF